MALEFVEASALVLYVLPNIWLNILGMFNLTMLQLSTGIFFFLYVWPPWPLETCFLSWSIIFNWDILALG